MAGCLKLKKIKFLVMAGILILTLFTGCNAKKELVLSGTIESTQIDISSEVAGKIIKLEKDEGVPVKKGDVLAVVDSSIYEYNLKQQEAVVKMKQARLDELKSGSRPEQISQAEAAVKASKAKLDELNAGSRPEQIKQAEAAVSNAKVNYDFALDKYNNFNALYEAKAVSENDLKDSKFKVDSAKLQLESAQAQLEDLKSGATAQAVKAAQANYEQNVSQLELVKNGSTTQAIQIAEADLEQSKAALEQVRLNLEKYQIKSSIDGTYIYRNAEIGDIISTGSSIAAISDLNNLWVKVYIPQKNLQSVALNQEISLKSNALPGKTIKGKITFIAGEAEFTPKNTQTQESKENTVFKLKINILDNVDALRPGMTVDAIIPQG